MNGSFTAHPYKTQLRAKSVSVSQNRTGPLSQPVPEMERTWMRLWLLGCAQGRHAVCSVPATRRAERYAATAHSEPLTVAMTLLGK
jgi:hypothetical protein